MVVEVVMEDMTVAMGSGAVHQHGHTMTLHRIRQIKDTELQHQQGIYSLSVSINNSYKYGGFHLKRGISNPTTDDVFQSFPSRS